MTEQTHGGAAKRQALAVAGMTCDGCARNVERALTRVPGVERALVDLSSGRAVVEGNAPTDALIAAVEGAGFGARPAA